MLAVIDVPTETWVGQRDRLLLTLMFNTGARVSEIIGVRVADVVLGPTSSIRLHGKGRKQRSLPLWKSAAKAVRDWLQIVIARVSHRGYRTLDNALSDLQPSLRWTGRANAR